MTIKKHYRPIKIINYLFFWQRTVSLTVAQRTTVCENEHMHINLAKEVWETWFLHLFIFLRGFIIANSIVKILRCPLRSLFSFVQSGISQMGLPLGRRFINNLKSKGPERVISCLWN